MRYTTKQYATALLDAVSATNDIKATALRFVSVLRHHKTLKRLDEILDTAKKLERVARGGKAVSIIAATESAMKETVKHFAEKDEIQTKLSPHVGGGVSVTIDGIRFDNTLRRRFNDLHKVLN